MCPAPSPRSPGLPLLAAPPTLNSGLKLSCIRTRISYIITRSTPNAAQHLVHGESPIRGAFALAGLCLAVEREFTGRQVQCVHTLMARRHRTWPRYRAPRTRRGGERK